MAKLVHFELTSAEVGQASDFYATVLGWSARPSPFAPDYVLLENPDGVTGAVMSNRYQSQAVILWFEVPDLDAGLASVAAAGGRQAGEINTIPGQGRMVYASDIDGTIFGLKQPE